LSGLASTDLFGGTAMCTNAASKLNAQALCNLFDLSKSRIQIVPLCVRFGLSQALHELWRFDTNWSSSQIVESCHTRTKSTLKEM
jgi:hypothetical protein